VVNFSLAGILYIKSFHVFHPRKSKIIMSKPKGHNYISLPEEVEVLLGREGLGRAQDRTVASTASKVVVLLYVAAAIALLSMGIAIGFSFRPELALKGLPFADTSQFKLCKRTIPSYIRTLSSQDRQRCQF
jgi:hypothetical protein